MLCPTALSFAANTIDMKQEEEFKWWIKLLEVSVLQSR